MKLENLTRANELSKARDICLNRIEHQEEILNALTIGQCLSNYGAVEDKTDGEHLSLKWSEMPKCINLIYDKHNDSSINVDIELYKQMLEKSIKLTKKKLSSIDKELETL